MKIQIRIIPILPCLLGLMVVNRAFADAPSTQPAEVTITANLLSNIHTGEKDKYAFILAYDGTPEIKAAFDKVVADYPENGLDADAAVKVQNQFMTQLKYTIDGPMADKLWSDTRNSVRNAVAITGVISERDGKKWITPSKCVATPFAFPAKLMAQDKPFVMPDKEALILPISDKISLKCIYVPAGKFMMGEPFYQCMHWQEDPPHVVTLSKSYYMAECPITQEIYEAVMGENPSTIKDPQMPVYNVDCANMYKFCEMLGKKTGRTIRVPTGAEWEYAARVGTSNMTYAVKYADQNSNANAKYDTPPLVVKSKKANPWGFYDMHSGFWERVADSAVTEHKDVTDPSYIPRQDKNPDSRGQKHGHMGKGQWTYAISEIEYIDSSAGHFRFRIVVETEPPASPATQP